MSLRDLAVITQTGDLPLKSSKVKLRLFDGSLMKPHGAATLKTHRNGSTAQLNFQVVDTKADSDFFGFCYYDHSADPI